MIWATVTVERAATVDDAIMEAVEVANLRYRTQWLPTLPDGDVAQLVADALTTEGRTPPTV
jgi:hypothetical protein